MICGHCGIPMRLINNSRARILLFWCPSCQRFAEMRRGCYRGRQPGLASTP